MSRFPSASLRGDGIPTTTPLPTFGKPLCWKAPTCLQVLVVVREMGVLKLGNISLDGSKIHADASKSHAVSYGRLLELEQGLRAEVEELMALGEKADREDLPAGLEVEVKIALRQEPLKERMSIVYLVYLRITIAGSSELNRQTFPFVLTARIVLDKAQSRKREGQHDKSTRNQNRHGAERDRS